MACCGSPLRCKMLCDTWFVVGGGYSVNEIDLGLLPHDRTIVINNVWRKMPQAAVMFFADANYYCHRRNEWWRYKGDIYTSIVHLADDRIKHAKLPDSDCNSGHQAVYLALKKGAKRVALVGFDGYPGRWADGTGYEHRGNVQDLAYKKYIDQAKRLQGLPITNTNTASAYPWFDFIPLETLLNDLKGD